MGGAGHEFNLMTSRAMRPPMLASFIAPLNSSSTTKKGDKRKGSAFGELTTQVLGAAGSGIYFEDKELALPFGDSGPAKKRQRVSRLPTEGSPLLPPPTLFNCAWPRGKRQSGQVELPPVAVPVLCQGINHRLSTVSIARESNDVSCRDAAFVLASLAAKHLSN